MIKVTERELCILLNKYFGNKIEEIQFERLEYDFGYDILVLKKDNTYFKINFNNAEESVETLVNKIGKLI